MNIYIAHQSSVRVRNRLNIILDNITLCYANSEPASRGVMVRIHSYYDNIKSISLTGQ
jgi:hypothetical protein